MALAIRARRVFALARSDPGALLIPAAFLFYATYGLAQHARFRTYGFDLGLFDQVVWLYSRFEVPYSTLREMVHLGDHFTPVLALLAPFYWLHSGPETLIVLQAALAAAAAVPVYVFARERIGRLLATASVLAFLAYAGIQNGVAEDVHPSTISVFFVAWTFYFGLTCRWRLFWPMGALALLTQEDISLIIAGFGAYLALTTRPRWVGSLTAVVSLGYFGLAQFVLMPHFANWTAIPIPQPTPNLDLSFGATPGDALAFAIAHPRTAFLAMFDDARKRETQLAMLAGWSGLPLLSPLGWLTGLPHFASRFLSLHEARWALEGHYTANFTPTAAFSTVLVLERGLRLARRFPTVPVRALFVTFLLAGVVATELVFPPTLYALLRPSFWETPASTAVLEEALRVIPTDATVGAQNPIFPHLSQRSVIQLEDRQRVLDYLVFDVDLSSWPDTRDELVARVRRIIAKGDYVAIVDRDPVFVLRRVR